MNLSAEKLFNGMGKWLTDIPSIGQAALNSSQISSAAAESKQCALAVGHFGCCNGNGVGQALRTDDNVALDPRYFLARIVAFLSGTIGVLDALCVDD